MDFSALTEALRSWAERRGDIYGLAIVGSYGRGLARADSDIDIVVLTTDPSRYLVDDGWLADFGAVRSVQHEDWGAVQSLRTFYEDGTEIEFGITSPSWADVPLDAGTREVIAGGFRVVVDRGGLLSRLLAAGLE